MTNPTNTRAATAADLAAMVAELDSLITVPQLAAVLGKSTGMVYKLASSGQLPAPIRVPGFRGLRWTPESIRGYIAGLLPKT